MKSLFTSREKETNQGNTLISMSQRVDGNTSAEIEKLAPIHVPDVRALPVGQD
jgi:hypothetical protein